ncbi:MAG: dolichyl-phosphate beta-glucosyltransferase [Acidimicrobiales bacterium]
MNKPDGDIELTIVIPAYNESQRLPAMLTRLLEGFSNDIFNYLTTQVLVVDDGSQDDTANVARSHLRDLPWANVVRMPANRGKGAAVRAGIIRARGEKLVFIDADMAIDPYDIPALVTTLDHVDIAIASRAHSQSTNVGPLVSRTVAGRIFNGIVRKVTGLDLLDTQCGFKGFRTGIAKLLFYLAVIDRFAFDVEILWIAKALGMNIEEASIAWKHIPGSHVSALSDPLSMLLDVYRATSQPPGERGVPIITVWPPGTAQHGLFPAPTPAERSAPDKAAGSTTTWTEAIRRSTRVSDLIVPWQGGAGILMPLSSTSEKRATISSLARRLPGIICEESWVTVGSLLEAGLDWSESTHRTAVEPDQAPRPVQQESSNQRTSNAKSTATANRPDTSVADATDNSKRPGKAPSAYSRKGGAATRQQETSCDWE